MLSLSKHGVGFFNGLLILLSHKLIALPDCFMAHCRHGTTGGGGGGETGRVL